MIRPRTRKVRGDNRTIPLKGYGKDSGKYFRCWHCGFICDIERDALGDANSRDGVVHETAYTPSYGNFMENSLSRLAVLEDNTHVAMENGADGQPKGVYNLKAVSSGSGCPLCGCLNWKGNY